MSTTEEFDKNKDFGSSRSVDQVVLDLENSNSQDSDTLQNPDLNDQESNEQNHHVVSMSDAQYSYDTDQTNTLNDPLNVNIRRLYIETLNLATTARTRAEIFKYIHLSCTLTVIILSSIITFLSVISDRKTSIIADAIIGSIIMCIGILQLNFKFSKRGIVFKEIQIKAVHLHDKLSTLQTSRKSREEMIRKVTSYSNKLSRLEMALYDCNIINLSRSNNSRNIPQISSS